jgi:hypothetical protein
MSGEHVNIARGFPLLSICFVAAGMHDKTNEFSLFPDPNVHTFTGQKRASWGLKRFILRKNRPFSIFNLSSLMNIMYISELCLFSVPILYCRDKKAKRGLVNINVHPGEHWFCNVHGERQI